MLNLYDSFDIPNVPNVKIYRDDENPHQFYMISERCTITRDDAGKPLFTLILYARDVDKLPPEQLEVERAYVALTTQAAVPKETEDKIRAYLRQKLTDELHAEFRFLGLPVVRTEPELGYPPLWLDGTVEFKALFPDMVPYNAGSTKPSLVDTNVASFAAEMNQEGAELFRQAVEKGSVPAIILYSLTFGARIPSIKIHVHGDRGEFYNEVKNYVRHRYESSESASIFGYTYWQQRYVYEWDELSSITKFRNTFHSLTIDVDDSSLPDSEKNAMKDKLQDMAFNVVQSNVLPDFFKQAVQEVGQEKTADQQKTPSDQVPVNTVNTGTLDILITAREIVKKQINPNSQLAQALTPDEIKAQTLYVDLSHPYFQELDVAVSANVNFTADPVYGLKVFLDYDQQDDLRNEHVKTSKEFLFKSADTVGRFRLIMAKAQDGSPKDTYSYWSEIVYKETGDTIRVPSSGATQTQERQLVISYRRLGFIKVGLVLGSMPDTVKTVEVKMTYPGSTLPTAQQSFELSKDKPTATFFTYSGQTGQPGQYRYQISYVLADGQRMTLPEDGSQAETLTIRNPFDQTLTTRFIASADFSVVQKLIVDAHYRDDAHDYVQDFHAELLNNGDTTPWIFGLRDPNKRDFDYTVAVLYKNGSRRDLPSQKAQIGGSLPIGEGAVDALQVTVIASTADWTKYSLILVYLQYDDPKNSLHVEKNFDFRKENADSDQAWQVLLRDATQRSYGYRLRYIGIDHANDRAVDWKTATDAVLVVE